jgi:hypothetical protein
MAAEQLYSDNFFRGETNEAEVWVTRISPGLRLKAETGRSRLDFDYSFSHFWHQDDEDDVDASEQDYGGHDLWLYAARRLFTRLTVGVSEEYFLTREPGSSDRFSQIVERNKYWRNRVNPFMVYDIAEKGEVKLGYRNERLEWSESGPTREDSSEDRAILTLTYHLNTSNHLDLEGQAWTRDYGGAAADYDSYQAKLIFRREFSSFFKGEVGAGYHSRDFDDGGRGDLDEFVFHGGLEGTTDLSKLSIFLERNIIDFTVGDSYFTAYRGSLSAEHIFLESIRFYAGAYYQLSDYEYSSREDDTYNGYAGLGYKFLRNNLELGLEYNHTNRDSNETGLDYEEKQVLLRLNVVYDFDSK